MCRVRNTFSEEQLHQSMWARPRSVPRADIIWKGSSKDPASGLQTALISSSSAYLRFSRKTMSTHLWKLCPCFLVSYLTELSQLLFCKQRISSYCGLGRKYTLESEKTTYDSPWSELCVRTRESSIPQHVPEGQAESCSRPRMRSQLMF